MCIRTIEIGHALLQALKKNCNNISIKYNSVTLAGRWINCCLFCYSIDIFHWFSNGLTNGLQSMKKLTERGKKAQQKAQQINSNTVNPMTDLIRIGIIGGSNDGLFDAAEGRKRHRFPCSIGFTVSHKTIP